MEKMENVTYMQAGPVLIIGLPEEIMYAMAFVRRQTAIFQLERCRS